MALWCFSVLGLQESNNVRCSLRIICRQRRLIGCLWNKCDIAVLADWLPAIQVHLRGCKVAEPHSGVPLGRAKGLWANRMRVK